MRRYGGLYKLMPITAGTFIVGWLAISGVPPFSGFWSKDEILLAAWANDDIFANKLLWLLLLGAAVLTAFYMSRLVFMTFFGERRWDAEIDGVAPEHEAHPHESPWTMWLPLVALAGLAAVGGLLNLPFTKDLHFLERWLEPSLLGNEFHVTTSGGTKWLLAIIAVIGGLVGLLTAAAIYLRKHGTDRAGALAQGWGMTRP